MACGGIDLPGQLGGQGLEPHADIGVARIAPLQELGGDLAGGIDRDGETQSRPRRLADGGVNADHLAPVINEGTAAVAGIHRRIGLQIGHPLTFADGVGALDGADDASGDGVVQPQGVANGNRRFAGAHLVGIPQRRYRQPGGDHLDDRHIGEGIGTNHFASKTAPIGEADSYLVSAVHHVGIGKQYTVRAGDETRALALLLPNPRSLAEGATHGTDGALDSVDPNDSRSGFLDGRHN